MTSNQMQSPGVFGGLMRYDSEYVSRFMFSPNVIIAFLIAIVAFVLVLKIFWPITSGTGNIPGFVISFMRNLGGF